MNLNPIELIKILENRGIELGPVPKRNSWEQIERILSLEIGSDFKDVYDVFDGFRSYDRGSQYRLWSVEEIINGSSGLHLRDGDEEMWIPIGDFLIESDIIVATIGQKSAKVRLMHEDTLLSENLEAFIHSLGSGKFDF